MHFCLSLSTSIASPLCIYIYIHILYRISSVKSYIEKIYLLLLLLTKKLLLATIRMIGVYVEKYSHIEFCIRNCRA